MSQSATRSSSYGNKPSYGSSSASGNQGSGKGSETTHYAYTGGKDDSGQFQKEFVNGVYIYRQESQYGSLVKVLVKEDIKAGTSFWIAEKRAK